MPAATSGGFTRSPDRSPATQTVAPLPCTIILLGKRLRIPHQDAQISLLDPAKAGEAESTQLAVLLDQIRVPRPGGRGRSRKRPDHLLADRGYSYTTCRVRVAPRSR